MHNMRLTRRSALQTMTGVGGFLILGSASLKLAAQSAIVTRRDVSDLATSFPDELKRFRAAVDAFKAKKIGSASAWDVNADAHRIYCSGDIKEIHGTWWFLPWHRAFLHATERNLQIASGDPSVALPYWHWPLTPSLPAAYKEGALDHERFGAGDTLLPALLDLTGMAAPSYRGRINAGVTVEIPFGGNSPQPGSLRSAIEGTPHGAVHNAIGSYLKNAEGQPINRNGVVVPEDEAIVGDMADLQKSAHDPIFFAHHSNIDRLWEVWRGDNASSHHLSEPWQVDGFAKSGQADVSFHFFDLLSDQPYTVKVDSTRTTEALGYRYAPPGERPGNPPLNIAVADTQKQPPPADLLSSKLATARVALPAPALAAPASNSRTVLTLYGVTVSTRFGTNAAIYITNSDTFSPSQAIFAGMLSVLASGGRVQSANFAFDVTEALGRLQPNAAAVHVFLVPLKPVSGQYNPPAVTFDRMEISR